MARRRQFNMPLAKGLVMAASGLALGLPGGLTGIGSCFTNRVFVVA